MNAEIQIVDILQAN